MVPSDPVDVADIAGDDDLDREVEEDALEVLPLREAAGESDRGKT